MLTGSERELKSEAHQFSKWQSGNDAEEHRKRHHSSMMAAEPRRYRLKTDKFILGLGVVEAAASYTLIRLETEQALSSGLTAIWGLFGLKMCIIISILGVSFLASSMDYSAKIITAAYEEKSECECLKYFKWEKRTSAWGRQLIILSLSFLSLGTMLVTVRG